MLRVPRHLTNHSSDEAILFFFGGGGSNNRFSPRQNGAMGRFVLRLRLSVPLLTLLLQLQAMLCQLLARVQTSEKTEHLCQKKEHIQRP